MPNVYKSKEELVIAHCKADTNYGKRSWKNIKTILTTVEKNTEMATCRFQQKSSSVTMDSESVNIAQIPFLQHAAR